MAKKTKVDTNKEDRRKWCVEIAVRWPQVGGYGSGMSHSISTVDADLIGRAKQIEAYLDSK